MGACITCMWNTFSNVPVPKDPTEVDDFISDPRHHSEVKPNSGAALRSEVQGDRYKTMTGLVENILSVKAIVRDESKSQVDRTKAACLLKNWHGSGLTDAMTGTLIVRKNLKISLYYAEIAAKLTPTPYHLNQLELIKQLAKDEDTIEGLIVEINKPLLTTHERTQEVLNKLISENPPSTPMEVNPKQIQISLTDEKS